MPYDKIDQLYDALKKDGAMRESRKQFRDKMTASGTAGYQNRLNLFNWMKSEGATTLSTYEDFRDMLGMHIEPKRQQAAAPKSQPKKVSRPQQRNVSVSPAKPTTAQMKPSVPRQVSGPASWRAGNQNSYGNAYSRAGVGVPEPKPLSTAKPAMVAAKPKPQPKQAEWPDGWAAGRKGAEPTKVQIQNAGVTDTDKLVQRMKPQPQHKDGETASQPLTLDGQIKASQKRLEEIEAALERRREEVEEVYNNAPWIVKLMRNTVRHAGMGSTTQNAETNNGLLSDSEYQKLYTAASAERNTLEALKDQLTRESGRKSVGFWSKAGRALADFAEESFTPKSLVETQAKLKHGLNNSEEEENADDLMMQSLQGEQEVQARYGNNESFLDRAGTMAGTSLGFAGEFAMTGGGFGSFPKLFTEGATKLAVKAIGKEAAETIAKEGVRAFVKGNGVKGLGKVGANWLIKATGATADDLMRGAAMTVTVQAPRTTAGIVDKKLGSVIDDGKGNLDFENKESWANAAWQGGADAVVENMSEMFGTHLDNLKGRKIAGKIADYFGAKKLGALLSGATKNGFTRVLDTTSKYLEKAGVNGLMGEVAEEYYGQLWRTALNLDSAYQQNPDGTRTNLFRVGQFHGDIWGGMGMTMGLMRSAQLTYAGVNYANMSHQVNKADKRASATLTPEVWTPLKDIIDNTTNDDFGKLADSIAADKSLKKEDKAAVMDYMGRSMALRGFNLGLMAQSRGEGAEQDKDTVEANRSYMEGYSAATGATPEQLHDIKLRYDYKRKRMEGILGAEGLERLDAEPVEGLSAVMADGNMDADTKDAVRQYVNFKMAYDGMMKGVTDDMDEQVERSNAWIDSFVNKDTGSILPATLKTKDEEGNDKHVYILKGNVAVNGDGTINAAESDDSIIVKDAQTGTMEFLSTSRLLSVGGAVNPELAKQNAALAIRQKHAREKADQIDGVLPFKPGDTYTVDNGQGEAVRLTIVGDAVDEKGNAVEGSVVVQTADGQQSVMERSAVQSMADAAGQARMAQEEQAEGTVYAGTQATEGTAEQEVPSSAPVYSLNDQFTIYNNEGDPVRGTVTGITEDGIEIETETPVEGSRVQLVTKEWLDERVQELSDQEGKQLWTKPQPQASNENKEELEKKNASGGSSDIVPEPVTGMQNGTAPLQSDSSTGKGTNNNDVPQTNVQDDNGIPFVLSSDGSIEFGHFKGREGMPDAPIRLSEGFNKTDSQGRNHGYGLKHIEASHGSQIRSMGYESVEQFVESVARNYDSVRKGNDRNGKPTYLLEYTDTHNNTLFIELSNDGSYWNVNSAGIFRKGYSKNKESVPPLPAVRGDISDDAAEVRSATKEGNSMSGNSSETSSAGKGTNNNDVPQANVQIPAMERIPKDEKGNPLYEQADAGTAWDALLEQAEGDADMAQEVADDMVADKEAALKKLQKQKPKGGRTPAEKFEAIKEQKRAVSQAEADLAQWRRIAGTRKGRERAAEEERRRAAAEAAAQRKAEEEKLRAEREEAERKEREALNGVPDWGKDTPTDARARGYRRNGAEKVDRQEPIGDALQGKEVEVKFSGNEKPKGHVAVIDAGQLQPSHLQGRRNSAFFLNEAQPKDRVDDASVMAAQGIAKDIRPEEITSSVTAYSGAPTVNHRGETIQGNSRSDALRYMYENEPEQAAKYKKYLIDHAEEFGLDAEAVRQMERPVLVNMMDVDDAEAIRLGQFEARDTESGGVERIKPKNAVQRLGERMGSFANILLGSTDEDASFSQLVDANGAKVLSWMNQNGFITPTQYRSAFDGKGNLTAEAANDLKGIMYQSIFTGGSTRLEELFGQMPAKAQRAILATLWRDTDSAMGERMVGEVQQSIIAFHELMQYDAFASAGNIEDALRAVDSWSRQSAFDEVTGEPYFPSERFSNFALRLAAMYKGQTQRFIQDTFGAMFDIVQGTEQDTLFETADKTPKPLAEAIRRVLGIEYKPIKGRSNGNNGSDDVDKRSGSGEERRPRSRADAAGGGRTAAGAGQAERGGGTPGYGGGNAETGGRKASDYSRTGEDSREELQGKGGRDIPQAPEKQGEYTLSSEHASNGEPFYQDANGNIDLADIPQEVFDAIGYSKAPFRLTPSMILHVIKSHGKELGTANVDEIVRFVLDVMNNFDHVRLGYDGALIFSIEDGRKRTGKRAVTVLINSDNGQFYGLKSSGYESIPGLNKRLLLWERGAKDESSSTDAASASVPTSKSSLSGEQSGSASHQSESLKNKVRTEQSSPEGGGSSISHADNAAPAISLQSRDDDKFSSPESRLKETPELTNSRTDVDSNLEGKSDGTATRQSSDVSTSKGSAESVEKQEKSGKNAEEMLAADNWQALYEESYRKALSEEQAELAPGDTLDEGVVRWLVDFNDEGDLYMSAETRLNELMGGKGNVDSEEYAEWYAQAARENPGEGIPSLPQIIGEIERRLAEKGEQGKSGKAKATESFLNVIKTLYAKGKAAAAKLYSMKFFNVAKTPDFMKELGLSGERFTIRYGVIARHFGKDGSHNLSEEEWEQLPAALTHPFAISRLSDKEKGYRIYTNLKTGKGEYVVVGVDVKNAGRDIEVNAIATLFGRRKEAGLPKNEEVVYRDKEITPEQSSLLSQPNSDQYPTAQELSDGKGSSKSGGSQAEGGKSAENGRNPGKQAEIEVAEGEVDTNPTDGQKEAGNYKKGHVQVGTFDITIEQPKGSVRRGTDANGKRWESKMHNTYGYIRGTEGVDGDHIDVFLSTDIDGWDGRKVFVIDQYNPDGTFDEHKVMLGFNEQDEAYGDYLANYEKGWEKGRKLVVTPVALEDFEKWIESSHRKTKPFAEYKSVKAVEKPYSISPEQYTTKRGKVLDMHLVTFSEPLGERQKAAAELARSLKGWYDKAKGGFMMRSEEDARKLAAAVMEESGEQLEDAMQLSLSDLREAGAKPTKKAGGDALAKVADGTMFRNNNAGGDAVAVIVGSEVKDGMRRYLLRFAPSKEDAEAGLFFGEKFYGGDELGAWISDGRFAPLQEEAAPQGKGDLFEDMERIAKEEEARQKKERNERRRKKNDEQNAADEGRMVERVRELAARLNLGNVEIVADASTLDGKRRKAKGFYNKRTGKITIVVPNHGSVEDIEQTLLHEAVAHYGLRRLFGGRFNEFLDKVYINADTSIRKEIAAMAARRGWDFRTATEEYLAGLAERTDFENAKKSGWWQKVKRMFAEMLESLGFGGMRLSDGELRYVLWRSYENLKDGGRGGILGEAADVAKQYELKVGNYAELTKNASLEEVNARFNEELDGLTEENADGKVLSLGRPSVVLRSAGVVDKPMKLYGNKVMKKMRKHGFALEELRNLPNAVAAPIAVFDNYNDKRNRSILTELRTTQGNFLVTITIGKDADVDFNIVTSVFGKRDESIVDWFNKGYATYINKEKALAFLSHQSAPIAATAANAELNSAAKVVENFENPNTEGENQSESSVLDKIKNSKPIEITGREVKPSDDLKQYKKNALEYGKQLRGEYVNKDTGESVFLGKNAIKEVLNHDYKNPEQLQSIAAIPQIIEESIYVTSKANTDDKVDAEKFDYYVCGLKIGEVDYTVRAVFVTPRDGTRYYDHKLTRIEKGKLIDSLFGTTPGFNQTTSLDNSGKDKKLLAILQEKVRGTTEDLGENQSDDILFRDGDDVEYEKALARDTFERRMRSGMYQMQEALQDSMLSLKVAMEAIYKAEGRKNMRIEDVAGFENAYLGENRLSSVDKAECDAFANLLFKPLLKAASKLAKTADQRAELIDYMMAKHGLERNELMRQREKDKLMEEAMKGKKPKEPKPDEEDYDDKMAAYEKEMEELREKAEAELADKLDGLEKRDFAGLTALTQLDDADAAEAEAARMVEDYEAAHDTGELWKRVKAVTDATLSKSYECGLMSKEMYEYVKSMYNHYIPLRGFEKTTAEQVYAYLPQREAGFNPPIKAARGRKSKADDPFASMEAMAESAIMQGNRNALVKQKFLNFALNHPSDLVSVSRLWLKYDDVAGEWKPALPDNIEETDSAAEVERKTQEFEKKMQQLAKAEPDKYKSGKEAAKMPYRVAEKRDERQHQVIVKRGGMDYVLTVNGNPRLAQALNGLTNPDNDASGTIGTIMKGVEKVNRGLSALYTTKNPDFIVSNFMRDMLYTNTMVWVKESPKYAARFHVNVMAVNPVRMKVLFAKHRNGKLDMENETERMFHQFMMNGGETGYANIRDIEKRKSDLKRELKKYAGRMPVGKAWDLLGEQFDELNRSVENCARFAAFMTSRQMGRSIDRSVWDAKDISVNFNKKGSGAKFLGANGKARGMETRPMEQNFVPWEQKFVPYVQKFVQGSVNTVVFASGAGRHLYVFWNAAIQGTTNFGRQAARHPAKAFTAMASMFLLGSLMAAIGGGDDGDDDGKDSYYNLPEYVRRSNIIFRAGDQWVSIPLPVEYRAVYGMGEMMTSVMNGKQKLSDGELASQIAAQMSQVMPIDIMETASFSAEGKGWRERGLNVGVSLAPSALRPIGEAFVNRSWTGLPIYKDTPWNKNAPEWTKAYSGANKQLVALSAALNERTGGDKYSGGAADINPAVVEHLLKGYFGGVASTVDKLVKMGETAVGTRDYNPRDFLILNRVVKKGDERTEYRALNDNFADYMDRFDKMHSRYSAIRGDMSLPIGKKIDMLGEFARDEEFRLLYVADKDFQKGRQALDAYREMGDEQKAKEMEGRLLELKRRTVNEMERIDGKR